MEPKDKDATVMAAAMWDAYMKETDPQKKRTYGLRYAFWADLRDQLKLDTSEYGTFMEEV